MGKALSQLKKLSLRDRMRISKSNKDFVIIDKELKYILTNDLERFKNIYIKEGGKFAVISAIKNDL
jgi:hypothetical protein